MSYAPPGAGYPPGQDNQQGYYPQQSQRQGGYAGSVADGADAQSVYTVDQHGYAAYHGPQQSGIPAGYYQPTAADYGYPPAGQPSGPQLNSQTNLLQTPMGSGPLTNANMGPGSVPQSATGYGLPDGSYAPGFTPGPYPVAYSGFPAPMGYPVQQVDPNQMAAFQQVPTDDQQVVDEKASPAEAAAGEWAGGYEEPDEKEQEFEKKFLFKNVDFRWGGLMLYVMYLFALAFYLYARISYTLDTGRFRWYSNMFLALEIVAAIPIILHGWPLTLRPISEYAKRFRDPTKKPPNPKTDYHVRFIVPADYHSISAVQATTQSLLDVSLPRGATRTIYLADDLGDEDKKEWAAGHEDNGVVYLSGRKRRYWEEVNPKASISNWVLRQLYPDSDRQGIISLREIVMIVEPGKIVSAELLNKTLYLMDTGSDVGMVITPACLADLPPGSDLFNNIRIPHWEFRQPGLDAMGFIDADGAPYIVRARALQSVGWLPEKYYAEDYVLGLQLTQGPWQSRLLQEYLVIHKGPQSIGASYATKYRDAVGHYQVMFSRHSGFAGNYTRGGRLLALATPLSMMVNFLTTPFFLAVPVVSIVWGVFPIDLNRWFAIAATIYYPMLVLLKYYGTSLRHVTVLWFEYVSNVLLWITHLRALIVVVIANLTSGRLMYIPLGVRSGRAPVQPSAMMPPIDYFLELMILGGIITLLVFGGMELSEKRGPENDVGVELPFALSYAWLGFSVWPYFLAAIYPMLDHDFSLRACCLIARFVQLAIFIFAIVFLWENLDEEIDYKLGLELAYSFYDAQRSGLLEEDDNPIPWRRSSLVGVESENRVLAEGGWYTDGLYGAYRHSVPIAFSTAMMSWGFDSFRQGHYDLEQFEHAQQYTIWQGATWLDNATLREGFQDTVKGMMVSAGNLTYEQNERVSWGRPEDIEEPRDNGFPVDTATDAIQVSAAMTAGLSASHKVYAGEDYQKFANILVRRAKALFSHSEAPFSEKSPLEKNDLTEKQRKKELQKYVRGGGAFISRTFYDDMFWAAAWLYRATQEPVYLVLAEKYFKRHQDERPDIQGDRFVFNYDDLFWGANIVLATAAEIDEPDRQKYMTQSEIFLHHWVCNDQYKEFGFIQTSDGGRAFHVEAEEVATTMNAAFLALEYSRINNKDPVLTQELRCWALDQVRYVLGLKRTGQSLYVGYGNNYPKRPASRAASCPEIPQKCDYGAYTSSEENPNVIGGALVHGPRAGTDEFKDRRSAIDNAVQLDWNAPMSGIFAALKEMKVSTQYCQTRQWGLLKKSLEFCKRDSPAANKDSPSTQLDEDSK